MRRGVSDSATPTLAMPPFCNNAESAEFLSIYGPMQWLVSWLVVSLVSKLKGGFNGNPPGSATDNI